jgi:lipopolysaccharide transport system ATP-binding protein
MILASHDFLSIKALCNRAIVMHKGSMAFDGNVEQAIEHYQALLNLN